MMAMGYKFLFLFCLHDTTFPVCILLEMEHPMRGERALPQRSMVDNSTAGLCDEHLDHLDVRPRPHVITPYLIRVTRFIHDYSHV